MTVMNEIEETARRKGINVEILDFTNRYREENKLPPLQWHGNLAEIAQMHATAVADNRVPFSHIGARERFACCNTRCINVAENLARSEGYIREDLPGAVVTGWCESEGHRRNLLGPFDVCGIGCAASDHGTIFITQLLALLDGQSRFRGQIRDRALAIATSTPTICSALGLVLAGPTFALGSGIVGTVLDYKYGLKPATLPLVASAKVRSSLGLQTYLCHECKLQIDGDLLVSGGDGRLLCAHCQSGEEGDDAWYLVK